MITQDRTLHKETIASIRKKGENSVKTICSSNYANYTQSLQYARLPVDFELSLA
ncbi:hypothetical protein METHB2_40113 [Candidatus Methylobacter favarea]|uniref:Uncharacterized protein n=1 Tax=Candidatus Methylobacter favarea TaxID=2707345 RepID=A0A8S0YAA2_9GAMM|nr:hypothetical protein METHB2_40113 [Candidatus Methylobacter favarea]